MASFADVERFLERVFERSTARLFRARIQPVQLERRVERAMERARVGHGESTSVPGRYRVRLSPADLRELAPSGAEAQALAGRLADAALTFARGHAYHLPTRPSVLLLADPAVRRGEAEVDAEPAVAVPETAARDHLSVARAERATGVFEPAASIAALAAITPAQGIRGDGTQTMVFRRPAPAPARAMLRVCAPDGSEREIEVGGPLDVGRGRDNGLVLADGRVSRHHGRLQPRRGALVYTDLGSTNGSRVNGIRVDEIALGIGDRVQVGDTVLVVEALPG